ncbi:hypothetical protein [Haloarcula halophila]|uniref:hypothetical protein n=1 Tax=Haloarcula TaxID=2237 RepID=UPI0023E385F1|nr:hypothetical protein [Halomicroarcula sp. DFY41]
MADPSVGLMAGLATMLVVQLPRLKRTVADAADFEWIDGIGEKRAERLVEEIE